MIKKKISANDCKAMFGDKFNSLTMKEIGIELKHFSMGTAPESPSFLVNQDDIKKRLVDKFCDFFDMNKPQVLEVLFLKSNYGNGKSHFIRTIYAFLNDYENVITKKVSLKQEETDLKKKILESISQKVLKECAIFLVSNAEEESLSNEKVAVTMTISEKYMVDANLANVLYEAARNKDIATQVQSIAILKNNYLPEYLKDIGCKKNDLNNEFYYDVIKLVSLYLRETESYLVIVFDEYEHVFSWKNEKYRKNLYEDIKLFTDNIRTFGNLFFVFAESDSVDNESESSDDPAFKSRKANLTYQIADISSENEVDKLFKMILMRYEKYYETSLETYYEDMIRMVNEDPLIKEKTNYRAYTQSIMRVLDLYRNKPPRSRKLKRVNESNKKTEENKEIQLINSAENIYDKWDKSTSISKKTILCEMLELMINNVGGKIISLSKKRGEIVAILEGMQNVYHIISTDNPSENDIKKRIESTQNISGRTYFIYPMINGDNFENANVSIVYYDNNTIKNTLNSLYSSELKADSMSVYLSILNKGSYNAEDRSS